MSQELLIRRKEYKRSKRYRRNRIYRGVSWLSKTENTSINAKAMARQLNCYKNHTPLAGSMTTL